MAVRPSADDRCHFHSSLWVCWRRRSLVPWERAASQPSQDGDRSVQTKAQRDKILSASGIDITVTVVPFRESVKLLGVTLDSVLTMDRHVTEVIRNCSYHYELSLHVLLPTQRCTLEWLLSDSKMFNDTVRGHFETDFKTRRMLKKIILTHEAIFFAADNGSSCPACRPCTVDRSKIPNESIEYRLQYSAV